MQSLGVIKRGGEKKKGPLRQVPEGIARRWGDSSAEGQVGPVEARLAGYGQVRGLVFGAFGEASEAVHEFVQVVAQALVPVSMLAQA